MMLIVTSTGIQNVASCDQRIKEMMEKPAPLIEILFNFPL